MNMLSSKYTANKLMRLHVIDIRKFSFLLLKFFFLSMYKKNKIYDIIMKIVICSWNNFYSRLNI